MMKKVQETRGHIHITMHCFTLGNMYGFDRGTVAVLKVVFY